MHAHPRQTAHAARLDTVMRRHTQARLDTQTHIHVGMFDTHTCRCVWIHTCRRVHTLVVLGHICTRFTRRHVHTLVCMFTCVGMLSHIHVGLLGTHTYRCVHTRRHVYTCRHVSTTRHVWTHARGYFQTCIHVGHVHTRVGVYTRMDACLDTHR